MASPWKFLTRLVLPRRQERQENGSFNDVKPDELAITKLTETAADNRLNTAEPPIDEKSVAHNQAEAVSADQDQSEARTSSVDGATGITDATFLKAADPILSDVADLAGRAARKLPQTGEAATRKRIKRGKKSETIEVVPPPSPAAVSDDAISLDEEIRLLRGELARRLQLQNAQLMRMLERFER